MDKKKFKKVVKWKDVKLDGKLTFIFGLIMIIPIVNILFALALISFALKKREVHWEEILKSGGRSNG